MAERRKTAYDVVHLVCINLKRLMEQHCVERQELAVYCETSVSTICNVLNEKQFLTARIIAGICSYFGVPIEELFKEPVHDEIPADENEEM